MDLKKHILGKMLELYNLLTSKGFKPVFVDDYKECIVLKNGKKNLCLSVESSVSICKGKLTIGDFVVIVPNGNEPIYIGFYHKDLISKIKELLY